MFSLTYEFKLKPTVENDLLEPLEIQKYYPDGRGAYERHVAVEKDKIGKEKTQTLTRKHLRLRTRIKRLARKTICFSRV